MIAKVLQHYRSPFLLTVFPKLIVSTSAPSIQENRLIVSIAVSRKIPLKELVLVLEGRNNFPTGRRET